MDELAWKALEIHQSSLSEYSDDDDDDDDDVDDISSFKFITMQSDTQGISEFSSSFDRDRGGGTNSLSVLEQRYVEVEMYPLNKRGGGEEEEEEEEDLDDMYEEFDDDDYDENDGMNKDRNKNGAYLEYVPLKRLQGTTWYKENATKTIETTTKQEPNHNMNSVIWNDKSSSSPLKQPSQQLSSPPQLIQNYDKDLAYLNTDFVESESYSDISEEDEISDNYIPLGSVKKSSEESPLKQSSTSEPVTIFWKKNVNRRAQDIKEEESEKPFSLDKEEVATTTTTNNNKKSDKIKIVKNKSIQEIVNESKTSVKVSSSLNENLLELNLVNDDNSDSDEDDLFLSKRASNPESDESSTKEPKAKGTTTRMIIREDPLSKPMLTAASSLRHSVCTITSVPVSLTMSPLGSPSEPDKDILSPPSPIFLTLSDQSSPRELSRSGRSKFVRVTTTPLSRKERLEIISRLQNFQKDLEKKRPKQYRKIEALEEKRLDLQAKFAEEFRKYKTWHKPRLIRLVREYAKLRTCYLDIQIRIAVEKCVLLQKKIDDAATLLEESVDRVAPVDPSFYANPLKAPLSPRDEKLLKGLEKNIRDMGAKVRDLVLESSMIFSLSFRQSSLIRVLDRIPKGALESGYFAPDYEVQADFDSWLLDERTREGQHVVRLCNAARKHVEKDISLKDIVLFIDEFVGNIIWVYHISSQDDCVKLALLVQRALFPLIYEDVLKMDPERQQRQHQQSIRSRDLALLEKMERLREERHPGIQIDTVFWSDKKDPFVEAERIISYLPFQLSPPDMINVLQEAVTSLCKTAKGFLNHNPVADEIIPLLVHIIVFASPPGLYEALFMMEYLSQSSDRDRVSGWCIAAYEIALNYIEKLELRSKK